MYKRLAAFSLLSRGGVYYAFLFQSQAFIFAFVCLTGRLVCRCAVSVEAHYREFFPPDNP
ncbi:hypothetical protein AUM49_18120 [Cronobacter sakazakii]|nr:hypothetical protein AUM49_18120 [Cronobacter sakazakii]